MILPQDERKLIGHVPPHESHRDSCKYPSWRAAAIAITRSPAVKLNTSRSAFGDIPGTGLEVYKIAHADPKITGVSKQSVRWARLRSTPRAPPTARVRPMRVQRLSTKEA